MLMFVTDELFERSVSSMSAKDTFVSIYKEKIHRTGSENLLNYLLSDTSDFFVAPSSTRYHSAYEGGLVQHSINVYECLVDYLARPRTKELYHMDYSEETVAVVALLHDICKLNFYKVDFRNAKNDKGVWEKVPYYTIEDTLPYLRNDYRSTACAYSRKSCRYVDVRQPHQGTRQHDEPTV
jgi:hypothetical protein